MPSTIRLGQRYSQSSPLPIMTTAALAILLGVVNRTGSTWPPSTSHIVSTIGER